MRKSQVLGALALAAVALGAHAADRVKVGFLSTMSGPSGFFGTDARDGFNLAVKMKGGKLGDLPAEVVVADDQVNPEVGRQAAERLIRQERVDFLAGNIFANVLLASLPIATQAERFVIATVPGPSDLAGEKCSPWFFTAGYQNDTPHEAVGKWLQDKGFKRVVTLVPNFVSGRDAVAGMKRYYKGTVVDEIFTKVNQLDYAAEIGQIRAANPDAVFIFLPGAMGVNFVKQFQASGLLGKVALTGFGFNFEDDIINATGDATVGAYNALQWSRDLDNPANKTFIAEFEREYKRPPTAYAALAYDAANLIDSAVREVKGKIEDKAALRRAIRAANFQSVRGGFKYGMNGMPIQTFYLRQVVKDGNRVTNKVLDRIFVDHVDSFASACPMK